MLWRHKLILRLLPPKKDSLRFPAIGHVEVSILLLLLFLVKLAVEGGVVDLDTLAYGAVIRVAASGAHSAALDNLALGRRFDQDSFKSWAV